MVTNETIDSFLIELDLPFEELGEGLWRVDNVVDNVPNIIIRHDPPIVLFRLKVMDVPRKNREELFYKLLELNAQGIALGAYAIDNGAVILLDTLRAESLDLGEFRASIESISLAATEHYKILAPFVEKEEAAKGEEG